jgi:hypothetical protein
MHENREISSAPWSDDQGRSAKAKSRTADMDVLEKSDCAVVPVNHPNKEGRSSTEAGEGRAQTRENIAQSHMHPTQSGKRMSQGLDGVRKAAKERKQERFTALLHHLNVDLLRDSFYALQRKASPGVDGVTWQEYETGLEHRLVDLHSRVHRGALYSNLSIAARSLCLNDLNGLVELEGYHRLRRDSNRAAFGRDLGHCARPCAGSGSDRRAFPAACNRADNGAERSSAARKFRGPLVRTKPLLSLLLQIGCAN